MGELRRFWLRLVTAIRSAPAEHELSRELQAHRQLAEDEFRRRGLSLAEARLAASRHIGGVDQVKEQQRAARGFSGLESLGRDVRYAIRVWRRAPGFSAIVIASLALGIGANTIIFGIDDVLISHRMPVPRADEVVNVSELWPGSKPRTEVPYWEFRGVRDGVSDTATVAAIAIFDRSNITLDGPTIARVDGGRARVAIVSGNYFPMLELAPAIGRVLTVDDDRVPGGHPVAVVSDAYWKRQLNQTPDVLSHTIEINQTTFAVVGVMPGGFTGDWVGRPVDVWVPTMMQGRVMIEAPDALNRVNDYWLRLVARRRAGVSIAQAEAAFQPAYQHVMREAAGTSASSASLQGLAQQRIQLQPAAHGFSPERDALSSAIATLTMIAGLVLLVVCANVAGLLLSRSTAREREFAVRLATGATPARVGQQILVESLVLAVVGGLLGLLLAVWGTQALSGVMARAPVQMFWATSSWISFEVSLDARGLLFTAAVSVLAGLAFGLAPVLGAGRLSLTPALSARAVIPGTSTGQQLVSRVLVSAQVAVALVVLAVAIMLMRSLVALRSQPLGFDRDHLMLVWTQPSSTGKQGEDLRRLWRDIQQRLAALPGVAAASGSNGAILGGNVRAPGRPAEWMRVAGRPRQLTALPGGRTFVLPHFFGTLGVPMLRGRDFDEGDGAGSRPVVIINETMARVYFGDENPVGRFVDVAGSTGAPVEIVGVVRDFERGSPRGTGQRQLMTFFPYDSNAGNQLVVLCAVVRTRWDPSELAGPVRDELRRIDPTLAVLQINTVDDQLDDVLAQDRMLAGVAVFFGGVSALIACLGLYGLLAHMIARRRAEIGIRMALGATRGDVYRLVLQDGVSLAVAGIMVGIPAALASTRLFGTRLFGVESRDPVTLGLTAAALMMAAVVAIVLPARRAARSDPMTTLREG